MSTYEAISLMILFSMLISTQGDGGFVLLMIVVKIYLWGCSEVTRNYSK
ncbi:hypothetical protein CACET_c01490 [Clostridium aceticum]|uniref:Uncharacterized protein n=1 Tax=Clostridium aceticum TaxID=84022 RepID=A0A0G3W6Y0_9CLOT|nr:putative holin-like toxin [Clostridium aceticum]AKL93667.1 hypothetical protein CACET_c01490 [Clostridium aceticum]